MKKGVIILLMFLLLFITACQSTTRERSYPCNDPSDCKVYDIPVRACLGHFECVANECTWKCQLDIKKQN